jgi:hypothetical protein
MLREHEAHWICLNRDCGKTAASGEDEREQEVRTCDCGGQMKKEAPARVYSYLNFLREANSSESEEKKAEEETPCESRMWAIQSSGETLRWS